MADEYKISHSFEWHGGERALSVGMKGECVKTRSCTREEQSGRCRRRSGGLLQSQPARTARLPGGTGQNNHEWTNTKDHISFKMDQYKMEKGVGLALQFENYDSGAQDLLLGSSALGVTGFEENLEG